MTKIVLCPENDYLWATVLPDDSEDCEAGPIIGPPEGLYRSVHNAFAKAGIYTAIDLLGTSRAEWLKLLDNVGVSRDYARTVVNVFQKEYFNEKEDE